MNTKKMIAEVFSISSPVRSELSVSEFVVRKCGNFALKMPRVHKDQVYSSVAMAWHLRFIVPETWMVGDMIVQRWIEGRRPTEEELHTIKTGLITDVRARGVHPHDLKAKNIIIDGDGKSWVVDVGLFEVRWYRLATVGIKWNGVPDHQRLDLDQFNTLIGNYDRN